jgi:hypothetical protein
MTQPRTWTVYGLPNTRVPGEWLALYTHPRATAMHGDHPVALTATEDPDGNYLGWIFTGKTDLTLIQWHQLFDMQFPYGAKAAIERGDGEVIHLSLAPVADTDTSDVAPDTTSKDA